MPKPAGLLELKAAKRRLEEENAARRGEDAAAEPFRRDKFFDPSWPEVAKPAEALMDLAIIRRSIELMERQNPVDGEVLMRGIY